MRKNNCEEIRRQLDELLLDEQCSASVSGHLNECSECREFHQTQTKLRQMVGRLGTVEAPADFEFRLRARLANDSNSALPFGFAYWSFARRGLAVASVLIVLAAGAVLLRNIMDQPTRFNVAEQNPPPAPAETPRAMESPAQVNQQEFRAAVPESPQRIRNERPVQPGPRVKRQLSAVDFSSERAEVISGINSVGTSAVFPIDASLQSLRVSLDDGRGNAKTISVPAISFGSQRTLTSGNQFTQKGSW
jgi:hypothetical protein